MAWIDLKESSQLENEIVQKTGRHLIFKHSPRCGISSMALRDSNKQLILRIQEIHFG